MLEAVKTSIGVIKMATRTAPVVAIANINKVLTTLHVVDTSGDNQTDVLVTSTQPADALVEAYANTYQLATQASLWKVSQSIEWVGDEDPNNADVGQRNSVKDGVNLLYSDLANIQSQTPRLVAPITAVMQGNQDIPLLTASQMTNLITATLAILTGFNLDSAQFTERRERRNNPRIKA